MTNPKTKLPPMAANMAVKKKKHLLDRLVTGLLKGAAAVLVLAVLGLCVLAAHPPWATTALRAALAMGGGQAQLSKADLDLFPPRVLLENLVWENSENRVELESLQVLPSVRDLFHKGPWLGAVEIQGLFLQTKPGKSPPENDSTEPDQAVLSRLFLVRQGFCVGAGADLALGSYRLEIEGLDMAMDPAAENERGLVFFCRAKLLDQAGATLTQGELHGDGTIAYPPDLQLNVDATGFLVNTPHLEGTLAAKAKLAMDPQSLVLENLEAVLPLANIRINETAGWDKMPIRVKAKGAYPFDGQPPQLLVESLEAGDWMGLSGRVSGRDAPSLEAVFNGAIRDVEPLMSGLRPGLPQQVQNLRAYGSLPFTCNFLSKNNTPVMDLETAPRDLKLEYGQEKWQARASLNQGSVHLLGRLAGGGFEIYGVVEALADFKNEKISLSSARVKIPVMGKLASPRILQWSVDLDEESISWQGPDPGPISASGDFLFHEGQWNVGNLFFDWKNMGRFQGFFKGRDKTFSGKLGANALSLENLFSWARQWEKFPYPEWTVQGKMELEAEFSKTNTVSVRAGLRQVEFASPDGLAMGQNLWGSVKGRGSWGVKPFMSAQVSVRKGEALWETIYLDLGQTPLEAGASGLVSKELDIRRLSFSLALGSMGLLTGKGDLKKQGQTLLYKGHVQARDLDLNPVFATFIKEPLAVMKPGLRGLSLSGRASLDCKVDKGPKKIASSGRLTVLNGEIARDGQPAMASGINLELPFSYVFGEKTAFDPGSEPEWGRLQLEKVSLAELEWGPFDLPVALAPNRFFLNQALDLPMWGANLAVDGLTVDEPLSGEFLARFKLDLKDLDLAALPLGPEKVTGRLSGTLDPVTLSAKTMKAQGKLAGSLFGGDLAISRLRAWDPLTPNRTLKADIDARMVDLKKLSTYLGMGIVLGKADIHVKGLTLAYNQPVAFDFTLESIQEKGVDQMVSLTAVNSISILSSGAGLQAGGASLLTNIFDEFPYKKMAFECGLKNDVFFVHGLIHENGVEYLVKKPFLRGINVVNMNKDNRISFSDMLKRVQRVRSNEEQQKNKEES